VRPYLPVLLFLFVASGCAALIYEIVWFQLLQLAIGSSAISLGVLLSAYMGGMCLGSLLLPRYVSPAAHPIRVYAALELGIGIFGILALLGIPLMDRLYAAAAVSGPLNIVLRALVAAICLAPPTLLMGASLPAMARWVRGTAEGVSWLGFFYGGNIAGAVFGSLLAGFYLLRVFDMATATAVAALLNGTVAAVGFLLARRTSYSEDGVGTPRSAAGAPAGLVTGRAEPARGSAADLGVRPPWVFLTISISGMCALGAEVVWTRLLALMMGATVYTFSIILAVFLAGLGIGSAVGSRVARVRAAAALGYGQALAALGVAWAAYTLSDSLPYWPVNPLLAPSAWFNFQIDLMRSLWTVFPAACMWGASFPLALAAAACDEEDPGQLVGRMYAANTVGAIVGAIGFSIVFIPWLGTHNSERLLIALAGGSALVMLVSAKRWVPAAATLAVAVVLIPAVNPVPWLAVAYGRRMLTAESVGEPLYQGDGMNSSIVISRLTYGAIYFHVSGKVEASTEPFDMRLQRMLGHLPALIHKGPKSVLTVGFGAGVTAGTFVVHPEVQRMVICELEKLIPPVTGEYFEKENHGVFTDKRTEIHYDDARHYVLTMKENFDVITSDPIHPWVKGTATLYSKEYFEMCKRHLNPGGVMTQWVPLYESDPDTVKSEIATFFEVFPNGTIWANDNAGQGYDVVLLGREDGAPIDLDALDARLSRPEQARVLESMNEVGFRSAADLFSTYNGSAQDLEPWLRGAVINTDSNLRLQYLAGMGLNFNNAPFIGGEIRKLRKFPEGLFRGTPERIQEIRAAINAR
jgi:spermidine synthase